MKIFFITILTALIGVASLSIADSCDRKDSRYCSYKSNIVMALYNYKTCHFIKIDKIVSLNDSFESGVAKWSTFKKRSFANNKSNYVSSCGRMISF